jgi:hypothetical protein
VTEVTEGSHKTLSNEILELEKARKKKRQLERRVDKLMFQNLPHLNLVRRMRTATNEEIKQLKSYLNGRDLVLYSEQFERQQTAVETSGNHASQMDRMEVIDSSGQKQTVELIHRKTLKKNHESLFLQAKENCEAGPFEPLRIEWFHDKILPIRAKSKADRRANQSWNRPNDFEYLKARQESKAAVS